MAPGMGDTGHRDRRDRAWGQMARGQGRTLSAKQHCPCSLPARARARISPGNAGHGARAVGSALPPPQLGDKPRSSEQSPAPGEEPGITGVAQEGSRAAMGGVMKVHASPWVAQGHHETVAAGLPRLAECEMCPNSLWSTNTPQNSQPQTPPAHPLPSKWVTELALPWHLLRAGCWVSPAGGDPNPARCCVRSPRARCHR